MFDLQLRSANTNLSNIRLLPMTFLLCHELEAAEVTERPAPCLLTDLLIWEHKDFFARSLLREVWVQNCPA
jgi:hypothetical protein